MERRNKSKVELKPTALPIDYLKLVEDTLVHSLEKGIVELKKIHPITDLKASGSVYADEVILMATLSHGTQTLAATTVYASVNFNPLVATPGIDDVLSTCLDAIGTTFEYYLDPAHPERIAQISLLSLSSIEEAPFEWTKMDESKIPVWVMMDKANPALESLTDEWLKKNDPHYTDNGDQEAKFESEDFLNERLEAIKNAKSGSGGSGFDSGGSGPIRH